MKAKFRITPKQADKRLPTRGTHAMMKLPRIPIMKITRTSPSLLDRTLKDLDRASITLVSSMTTITESRKDTGIKIIVTINRTLSIAAPMNVMNRLRV